MSIEPGKLIELIRHGDAEGVVTLLSAADEPSRRTLAPALKEYRNKVGWSWQERKQMTVLAVAGAACVPGAAGVVSWLRNREFRWVLRNLSASHLITVLSLPGRPAMGVVARQLAEKMRPTDVEWQWTWVWKLLDASDVDRPLTDNIVRGWARYILRSGDRQWRDLPDVLRTDPWTAVMLPRLFEVDGLGLELESAWPAALAQLSREGAVDRTQLLAGCLFRLRVGDDRDAIRNIIDLHREIAPSLDEIASHQAEYIGLLASPTPAIVELAQTALRELDEVGRLPVEALVEASGAILPRTEKKLVRAQLAWLDRAARRERDRARSGGTPTVTLDGPPLVQLLGTTSLALSHEAPDLADRALTVIARHLPHTGDEGRQLLLDTAEWLTGDLRQRVEDLLGVPRTARQEPFDSAPASGPDPVEFMPPPIASVAELAGEVVGLVKEIHDPVRLERVLDGLVRFVHTDRAALVEALRPLNPLWSGRGVYGWFCELLQAASRDRRHRRSDEYHHGAEAKPPPLEAMWVLRMDELVRQFHSNPPRALLATPATVDGHVDPDRVVRLLAEAERDGWQPGPVDVTQMLLRLPRDVDASVVDAAAALTAPAGRRLHRWLTGERLPDPEPVRLVVRRKPCRCGEGLAGSVYCWCGSVASLRIVVGVAPVESPLRDELMLPEGLLGLPTEPDAAQRRAYGVHWAPETAALWPSVLPSQRELVAAHVLPSVAPAADADRNGGTGVIATVARLAGPCGPATSALLAYGLAARRDQDRLPAVDAVLTLARRGELDGARIGADLAQLVVEGVIVLRRVVASLGEVARADAHPAVWEIGKAMLPALLALPKPLPGTPDLLALAAAAAGATGVRAELPAVAAVAARAGSGRLVTEARRLVRTLTVD